MKKNKVCIQAYKRAEILGIFGDVTPCCLEFTNRHSFGDIRKQSFEEIWNGEIARDFRRSMLDGSFKYCNKDLCMLQEDELLVDADGFTEYADWPEEIEIGVSTVCNVRCRMCRDHNNPFEWEKDEIFRETMFQRYMEIIPHIKKLFLNSFGEALIDNYCKRIIQEALKINPNLKICLLSNGIFCNEEKFKEYGILDNTEWVQCSIHAATKETYNKIVRGGDFDKVKKNVEWLAQEKEKGRFERVTINFVVNSLNYHEMVLFAKWAKSLNITCCFWEVRRQYDGDKVKQNSEHNDDTEMVTAKNYPKYAVFLPEHPQYKNFVKVLQHPIFKEEFCETNKFLKNIIYSSQKESFKKPFIQNILNIFPHKRS